MRQKIKDKNMVKADNTVNPNFLSSMMSPLATKLKLNYCRKQTQAQKKLFLTVGLQ